MNTISEILIASLTRLYKEGKITSKQIDERVSKGVITRQDADKILASK